MGAFFNGKSNKSKNGWALVFKGCCVVLILFTFFSGHDWAVRWLPLCLHCIGAFFVYDIMVPLYRSSIRLCVIFLLYLLIDVIVMA